jgi:hypothetical protein
VSRLCNRIAKPHPRQTRAAPTQEELRLNTGVTWIEQSEPCKWRSRRAPHPRRGGRERPVSPVPRSEPSGRGPLNEWRNTNGG